MYESFNVVYQHRHGLLTFSIYNNTQTDRQTDRQREREREREREIGK